MNISTALHLFYLQSPLYGGSKIHWIHLYLQSRGSRLKSGLITTLHIPTYFVSGFICTSNPVAPGSNPD